MKHTHHQESAEVGQLDLKTALEVDSATRELVKTLPPDHDAYEGFILGFAAAWKCHRGQAEAERVAHYLHDTL